MNGVLHGLVVLVSVGCSVFVALFLGGLASAALEIRRERKAGLEPTRPAWENREKRRALGGFIPQVKAAWAAARHPGADMCWCGIGLLYVTTIWDGQGWIASTCCSAWEVGYPEALERHEAAGGYKPAPVPGAVYETRVTR